MKKGSGLESVAVDNEVPVEFYNLQGVRVANPEAGIYIRRQGSNVTKVYPSAPLVTPTRPVLPSAVREMEAFPAVKLIVQMQRGLTSV